jgi:hypothetical protein
MQEKAGSQRTAVPLLQVLVQLPDLRPQGPLHQRPDLSALRHRPATLTPLAPSLADARYAKAGLPCWQTGF